MHACTIHRMQKGSHISRGVMAKNGMSNGLEESWKRLHTEWPKRSNISNDEIMEIYSRWEQYDQDMAVLGYQGADVLASDVDKLGLDKDALILDVGCGTGLVGDKLKALGYSRVHGHDGCEQLLDQARGRKIYEKYLHCMLGGVNILPVNDGHYDAVITAGGASPGHFPLDVFTDMFRVIKPGGYFAHVCRDDNLKKPQHTEFWQMLKQHVDEGTFAIVKDNNFGDYYLHTIGPQILGRVQVVQKLK